MKRLVPTAAMWCALALVAVSCDSSSSSSTAPTPAPTTSSPTTSKSTTGDETSPATGDTSTAQAGSATPPTPGLAKFYGQSLSWSSCQGDFQCAKLTVPLDYADPTGQTIEINVLKVPASGDRQGSLIVNPGGPGAPGTSYAAAADRVFGSAITDAYDVVGFDPRGTGDSDPVNCLTDSQLDDFISSDPNPDTPAEVKAYIGYVDEVGRGCVADSGALASHVSTIEAARDMDVLRSALGEDTMTYFGASYGTKLGATYADLFPKKVGRMVLDGAVDLSIGFKALDLGQAGGFQTALDAYVQNCIDTSDSCFLGSDLQTGLTRIRAFLDSVDATPLPTDDSAGRTLKVGNAFYGLILPLYSRDNWGVLSQALQQAFKGDGSTLLRLSDLYSSRNADGTYSDNSAEAIYAINCLDDPSYVPASQIPALIPEFDKVSPTFGDIFAWGLTNCEGQIAKTTEKPRVVHAAGAAPIVVIGTTRDPATPYVWAQHLAAQLDSGVLISRDGDGHTGYNMGNQCIDSAVEDYLVKGVVPRDGLMCAAPS